MQQVLAFALLLPLAAHAASFVAAYHDGRSDEIVVDIAYEGTRPGHDFIVEWEACDRALEPNQVTGRVIDRDPGDVAGGEHTVRMRFDASTLPCRPAIAILRLGPTSNLTVFVPERPSAKAGGAPGR